jgi:8-oxo-dGTP pyrophosphatase MutT (NUDIX family)
MFRAAGVLIGDSNSGKILGFRRLDEGRSGVALPCGGIEDDETPQLAAIREALEETGYVVRLLDDQPYVANEKRDNVQVYIYKAEIVEQKVALTPAEGIPVWVKPTEILDGPYGDFNRKMLVYFGYDV